MSAPLKQLAMFIRDLMLVDEQSIRIGRENYDKDFQGLQIVVDSLGQSVRLSTGETFDDIIEEIVYYQQWRSPCTVDFYGEGSFAAATKFSLLLQSMNGYELQRDSGLTVYSAGGLTDVKALTGAQYSSRYQLALNVQYSISTKVDTLRIDTAQVSIINDK